VYCFRTAVASGLETGLHPKCLFQNRSLLDGRSGDGGFDMRTCPTRCHVHDCFYKNVFKTRVPNRFVYRKFVFYLTTAVAGLPGKLLSTYGTPSSISECRINLKELIVYNIRCVDSDGLLKWLINQNSGEIIYFIKKSKFFIIALIQLLCLIIYYGLIIFIHYMYIVTGIVCR